MLPLPDPVTIRDEIARLGERLLEALDETRDGDIAEPRRLTEALSDVLDTLQCRERLGNEPNPDTGPTAHAVRPEPSLGDLGDHAVELLAQLADRARGLQLVQEADALEGLLLPLASCVARAGGELTRIGPVVHAVEALGDAVREPGDIAGLFRMTDDLFRAVSPRVSDAVPGSEDARVWRVLIINRAILATRTHQPALMATAFDTLIEQAPEEAAGFFHEGIGQMEALDYPASVKALMQRYYDAWGSGRRLH